MPDNKTIMPDGYVVLEKDGDTIIIGVTDFLLQTSESVPFIDHEGVRYERGLLMAIPSHLANEICSCREYVAVKGETEHTDRLYFSQRNKMEKIIRKWMAENGCSDCPLNTISFLQQNGLVDIDKIRDFIEKGA